MLRSFLIVFLFLAYGCKRPPQEYTLAKASWPSWDLFQIGIQQSQNDKVKTRFTQKNDYLEAMAEIKNGRAVGATLTIYEALTLASEGIPVKIILLLDYTIGSDGVVAAPDITSPSELKGKRIGVEFGSISHYTALKALEKGGLKETDVTLVDLKSSATKDAFSAGRVDAVATYEPILTELIDAKPGAKLIFSSLEIPGKICDVLFVKEGAVSPPAADHWIQAWDRALNYRADNYDEALGKLSTLSGTQKEDLARSFRGIYLVNLTENRKALGTREKPGYLADALREMQQFMLEKQVIKRGVPVEGMIDFESINRVASNPK